MAEVEPNLLIPLGSKIKERDVVRQRNVLIQACADRSALMKYRPEKVPFLCAMFNISGVDA